MTHPTQNNNNAEAFTAYHNFWSGTQIKLMLITKCKERLHKAWKHGLSQGQNSGLPPGVMGCDGAEHVWPGHTVVIAARFQVKNHIAIYDVTSGLLEWITCSNNV